MIKEKIKLKNKTNIVAGTKWNPIKDINHQALIKTHTNNKPSFHITGSNPLYLRRTWQLLLPWK